MTRFLEGEVQIAARSCVFVFYKTTRHWRCWNRKWVEKLGQKAFLSHLNNDRRILVYATRENYTSLSLCDTIYIDGTFNTCREPYSQLVTYTTSRKHLGRVFTFYVSFHLKDHWAVQAAFQTRKRQNTSNNRKTLASSEGNL